MANLTAGTGQHSHEVPSEVGRLVVIRDGNHAGTDVERLDENTWRFVSYDAPLITDAKRCVLVRLTDVSVDELRWPYGCDLESPDGLALIGCNPGDEVPGEVLWDSAVGDFEG